MDIGIGLPATIPGVERDSLLEWARRSEAAGFSTLGTIDRIVYPNWEPLISLAAAAAVTERIRLTTAILISPLRANNALLAKQAATIDQLSNGRLVLGLAPGGREDDYTASGLDFHARGKWFEQQLDEIMRVWAGEERGTAGAIGPPPARSERPSMLLGGTVDASFERAARFGDGWIAPGGGPDQMGELVPKLEAAWERQGRDGTPRKVGLAYFALGSNAEDDARSYLTHYYAWLGDEVAGMIASSAATSADDVKGVIAAYEQNGADELIIFPSSQDPAQVELLAEAAL